MIVIYYPVLFTMIIQFISNNKYLVKLNIFQTSKWFVNSLQKLNQFTHMQNNNNLYNLVFIDDTHWSNVSEFEKQIVRISLNFSTFSLGLLQVATVYGGDGDDWIRFNLRNSVWIW